MKTFVTAAFAALFVTFAVAACNDSNTCDGSPPPGTVGLTCDPDDGIFKCGGRGGTICGEGFHCDATSNTCVTDKCGPEVKCAGGTSCDVTDGVCKCGGTGGDVCGEGQVCNSSGDCVAAVSCSEVACPANQTCDQATGQCLCGTATCAEGQYCQAEGDQRTCVDNKCAGVTCVGGTRCDPVDGQCKCAGESCAVGDACTCPEGAENQSCAEAQRSCELSSLCDGVTCSVTGTTCDPTDGVCKCGGPGGSFCGEGQVCDLTSKQCMGGGLCDLPEGGVKTCPSGLSCDPETGLCKCGGLNGKVCSDGSGSEPAEICISSANQHSCRRPCDPTASDCPADEYCFFDPLSTVKAAYCSAPTGSQAEGQSCSRPTDCFQTDPGPTPLNCTGLDLGQTGVCRAYCNPANGPAGCVQTPRAQTCEPIPDAPATVGFCQPQ